MRLLERKIRRDARTAQANRAAGRPDGKRCSEALTRSRRGAEKRVSHLLIGLQQALEPARASLSRAYDAVQEKYGDAVGSAEAYVPPLPYALENALEPHISGEPQRMRSSTTRRRRGVTLFSGTASRLTVVAHLRDASPRRSTIRSALSTPSKTSSRRLQLSSSAGAGHGLVLDRLAVLSIEKTSNADTPINGDVASPR